MKLIDPRLADFRKFVSPRRSVIQLEDAWACGNIEALPKAIAECMLMTEYTPAWVLEESHKLIVEHVFGKRGRTRGRGGNPIALTRQDLLHARRAEEVEIVLAKRKEIREAVRDLTDLIRRSQNPSVELKSMHKERQAYLGATARGMRGACETASRLSGLDGKAMSARTMRRSAARVRISPKRYPFYASALVPVMDLGNLFSDHMWKGFENALLDGKSLKRVRKPFYRPKVDLFGKPQTPSAPDKPEAGDTPEVVADVAPDPCPQPEVLHSLSELPDLDIETAVRAGNILALLDALQWCIEIRRPAPSWLLNQTLQTVLTLLQPKGGRTKGRTGGPASECREELKHFIRCEFLRYARQFQELSRRNRLGTGTLQRRGGKGGPAAYKAGPRQSWRAAMEMASTWLAGTTWECTPDQIKKSFQKVIKDKGLRSRFWIPSMAFVDAADDIPIWTSKMGKEYIDLLARISRELLATLQFTDSPHERRQAQWRKTAEIG